MPLLDPNGSKCSILIVEDDDDIRAGLRREVEGLGHDVVVVTERDEALVREDQSQFDLLVTDLVNDRVASVNDEVIRSFKVAVTSLPARRAIPALHDVIERTEVNARS
jgi:CheY-like chemotaxis protein